ncbi:unnamed protein product [Ostreobium quekettii]|uniref:Uncharacterized protein n=1 Tax=Ostreobium quekettii TaxID=121088 RepID=A0A8S1IKD6_9CHLO|nr:unnamed protein product [Ostreobium quekettii]|eukprot:evm.model.scf_7.28 EVM.evm.TU.scf_7.28   scf_7:226945-227784(-)
MMPFTFLWLPNPVDEAVFARRYAAKYFAVRDLMFRAIRACVIPVFLCVRLWQHGLGWQALNALLNVALNVLVEWMGFGWQRDALGGKRTAMAVATRIVILLTQAMDATSMEIPVQTPLSMVRFMLLPSGLLVLFLTSIFVPLLARHHLPVTLAGIVAMGFVTVPNACDVAVSAPESGAIVLAVWHFTNAVFTGGVLGESGQPAPYDACQGVVNMAHFVLGFLLPSFAMWAVEYEERTNFSEGISRPRELLTNDIIRKHMFLFFLVMGCVWLFLNLRVWM